MHTVPGYRGRGARVHAVVAAMGATKSDRIRWIARYIARAWRSYFLTAATELRSGVPDIGGTRLGNADFLRAVPTLDLFDMLASRYAPERLQRAPFSLQFTFRDTSETISLEIGTSVIVPRDRAAAAPTAGVTLDRASFEALLLRTANPAALMASGAMEITGDMSALASFFGLLEQPDFWFATASP